MSRYARTVSDQLYVPRTCSCPWRPSRSRSSRSKRSSATSNSSYESYQIPPCARRHCPTSTLERALTSTGFEQAQASSSARERLSYCEGITKRLQAERASHLTDSVTCPTAKIGRA